jgi:hypothetical protein
LILGANGQLARNTVSFSTSFSLSLLLAGGPIPFLAAQNWYYSAVLHMRSRVHWIGGLALFVIGLVTLVLPSYAALILISSALAALAILD